MSETMPCSAQKSSISCVSAMPPISEPAMLRRLKIRPNGCGDGCGFSGAPTSVSVPSRLSSREEGIEVVRRRDRVEDEVEAVRVRAPSAPRSVEMHDLVRAQAHGIVDLARRGGEQHDVRAHRVRDLHAHVAEPAEADDADRLARADVPVAQRRVGRDAGAQQRRDGRELLLVVADPAARTIPVDHDRLRIAAVGVLAAEGRAVVGADEAVLAVLLEPVAAGRRSGRQLSTMQPTPARSPSLEPLHLRADRDHAADDLVAGHARDTGCSSTRCAPCAGRSGRRRSRGSRSARRPGPGSRRSMLNGASGVVADCAA